MAKKVKIPGGYAYQNSPGAHPSGIEPRHVPVKGGGLAEQMKAYGPTDWEPEEPVSVKKR